MPAEKIMIVDDERLVRWSLRQKCEEWGYHVIEADAGEPGLKLAQRESPDLDELHVPIKNALEATSLRTEVQTLRGEVRRGSGYDSVVGVSPKMTELMNFVRKVASSEGTTILIQGESGTGKDLIAKAIHYESSRQERPFVAINCSAIPETLMEAELFGHEKGAFTDAKQMKKGLFEAADGGTLFLDEIGEL